MHTHARDRHVWLTEWERTGDARPRAWLENSRREIAACHHHFFSEAFGFDPVTKKLTAPPDA